MTPETRRILLATTLSAVIMFAFMWFQSRNAPPRPAGAGDAGPASQGSAKSEPSPSGPAQAPGAVKPAQPVPALPEETAVLETRELKATFTTVGGALKSLQLKEKKFQREVKGVGEVPVDLVHVAENEPWPNALVASPELGGTGGLAGDPASRGSMRITGRDAKSVTFEGLVGTAEVRKRFFLGERPYELGLELHATAAQKGELVLLYPGFVAPDAPKPGFFSGGEIFEGVTPLCRAAGKTSRFDGEEAKEAVAGAAAWVGLDQHYFVSAVMPTPEMGECLFFRGPGAGELGAALRLPLDRTLDVTFKIYKGPKQLDLLRAEGRELDSAVDYGAVANLFAFFARILLYVMKALESVVKNWGVAIILLTVVVKALLYPLTAKSMRSMNEMRKLQPEIEKLKAKHGDDKEKLNVAVMQLYQQHKVNPLGGCLPMLIQMPIWFALYATLQTSVELYNEPFLWLRDLTRYDPLYILPLTMGASSFLMQKISPQPADNTQAKMLLYIMPVFFTFIMLKLPAGLTLYILVNNVLSIAQQQWLMRRHAATTPAKA
ncbi:MAG: protein translocase component YidC [Anaeromyxobacter sp. RBG_16_69_14]|nr:MAG: protein translocase component YidC [Anaeromyxobacter sp. RBG_16_69_14]